MKHGFVKKWTALLLALAMLAGLMIPSLAASSSKGTPVIFLPDMTDIIFYQNPDTLNETPVFNWKAQSDGYLRDILAGLLQASLGEGNGLSTGVAKISGVINDIFKSIQYNEYGQPKLANVGPLTYNNPVVDNAEEPIYTENIASFVVVAQQKLSADRIFVFNYDRRADSYLNAGKLKDYIDYVIACSGCRKVSLVSGGCGGAIVNAYLYFNETHAAKSIESCVFLDSFADGSSIIGDVMSGDLIRTVTDVAEGYDGNPFELGQDIYDTIKGTDVGDALSRYISTDPTGLFKSVLTNMGMNTQYENLFIKLAISLAGLIIEDQGLFTKVGSGYREVLMKADESIYAAGLREYMRNMPGLWAIVPTDSYQQALYFMFGNDLDVTPELMEMIERSNKVMKSTEKTLHKAQQNGINVSAVAGYNLQILPITSSLQEQSDGLQATRYAGLGATTGDMKHNLKQSQQCKNGYHNHVEPNKCVDAATCYMPENTWFIKDHEHMNCSADTLSAFLVWLVTNSVQRTVWQSNLYPQYLQVNSLTKEISAYSDPVSAPDSEYIYGDLDMNGHVDAADARMALRYAIKLEKSPSRIMLKIGDVNHSNAIDTNDARLILRYSIGLEKSLGGR